MSAPISYPQPSVPKPRVLVVDDERIVAEDISECLGNMGCDIVGVAMTGADAIALARRHRPDLVLMDVCLAGDMDGIQAATLIRDELEIPAVFLTAYSDGGVLTRSKLADPAGYIVKPFEETNLRSTVEIALHKSSMERSLRQNHEWFVTILASMGDGVLVADAQGMVRFMNPAAEQLTGWDSFRVLGRQATHVLPLYDARTGDRRPHPVESAGEQRDHADTLLLRADGSTMAIDLSSAPVRNRHAEITGTVLIFRDVTSARQTTEQLRQYQQHLESMVQDRIAEVRDTNQRLLAEVEDRRRAEQALASRARLESIVASISGSFLELAPWDVHRGLSGALGRVGTGISADAAVLYLVQANGAEITAEHEWCASPVIASAGPQSWPFTAEPVEGARRHLLHYPAPTAVRAQHRLAQEIATRRRAHALVLVPLIEQDRLMGYLGVEARSPRAWTTEEIDLLWMVAHPFANALHRQRVEMDKRRLQEQLTRSQRMEAVGRLSGGIAHDFNNTLLPIIGYADMLLDRLPASDPARTELTEIRRAARHAATLTRQLLAFSKRQVVHKVVFDLNEDIVQMRNLLKRIVGENMTLETSLTDGLPPLVADPGQIEQVVMNLIVNARDAMPDGGTARIRTALVPPEKTSLLSGRTATAPHVRLTIEDTGVGIPQEIRDRIFDPFFSTKGAEGTGLGLAVIFSIIEQHQGGIEVESEVGRGTAFHIFLPCAEPSAGPPDKVLAHSEAPVVMERGHGQRILLVEDEEAVQKFVSQALTQHGYHVRTASCVAEAWRTFQAGQDQFDMVFSDAVLPDGNGIELIGRLLGSRPAMRALLSSGYTDKNAVIELSTRQEISFLQKPYSLPDLLRKVSDVLQQKYDGVLN